MNPIQHVSAWRHAALASTVAGAFCLALPAAAAVSGYNETWNTQGNLAGWFANTIDSTVVNPGVGGHPGGYLQTRRSGSFPIGAATDLAAATGSFSGQVWTARFDLIGQAGATSDVWLRFRYLDSSHNGWMYRVTGALDSSWQTFDVTFDANWTDAQAIANGWKKDLPSGFASVSWAETMGAVYTTEIRLEGTSTLLVGIDNFALKAAPVPEPSTFMLMLGGLIGVGWVTARQRGQPR
jgi:hypothetical protein